MDKRTETTTTAATTGVPRFRVSDQERARDMTFYDDPSDPCLLDRLAKRPETFKYIVVDMALRLEEMWDGNPYWSQTMLTIVNNGQWKLVQAFILYRLGGDVLTRRMFKHHLNKTMRPHFEEYVRWLAVSNYLFRSTAKRPTEGSIVAKLDTVFVEKSLDIWVNRRVDELGRLLEMCSRDMSLLDNYLYGKLDAGSSAEKCIPNKKTMTATTATSSSLVSPMIIEYGTNSNNSTCKDKH